MLANCAASHLGAWLPHETTVCRSERPALSPAATWHLLQLANDAARSRGAVLAATAVALSVRQLHGRRRCGLLRHHPHRSVALRAEGGLPVRIETKGVPVLLYAPLDQVEDQAREQLISLAESPLPVGHVAAMPDVHMGKGVAIGAVFASEKYVCPNAVGVDIGCGMCAVPVEGLFRNDLSMEQLHDIQRKLKLRIPTSFDSHDQSLSWANDTLKNISNECEPTEYLQKRVAKEEKIARQLGTLGGGNHFIELVYAEEDDQVWCMLHSGSRNVGNTTAAFYDRLAGERGKFLQGVAGSLNYLAIDSEEGRGYLKDMTWCQAYARENRRSMLQLMVETVEEVTGKRADLSRAVNAHHNFCQCETCNVLDSRTGKVTERKLWVTRKGATSARPGQYGIIPGSMGVGSYIVKGRGADGSWQSCSHGAGRRMSRTKAKKTIPQEDFVEAMKGIVCDTDASVRDEAPQAYKDLGQVLENQRELVDVEFRLLPLVNVKGFENKAAFTSRRKSRSKKKGRKK